MVLACRKFLADMWAGREPYILTLCGPSGTGKTHLAQMIRHFLIGHSERIYKNTTRKRLDPDGSNYLASYVYQQEKGIFVRWADLVKTSRDGDHYSFARACKDWVKIVDDIGAAGFSSERGDTLKLTPFVLEKLGDLCDSRLRKWTVLTSNYNRRQIAEQFDVRIASRLGRDNNVIIECDVQDFSLRNKKQ